MPTIQIFHQSFQDSICRWAFESYNFLLVYHPGSKNTKADSLSRQFSQSPPQVTPDPVLPSRRFSAPLHDEPAPPETPPNRLYVPTRCRQQALIWGYSSPFSGHSGQARTLSFLQRTFWWPSTRHDIHEFDSACDICGLSKPSSSSSAWELQPLKVLKCPWAHFRLEFVTGLPCGRFGHCSHHCGLVFQGCPLGGSLGLPSAK